MDPAGPGGDLLAGVGLGCVAVQRVLESLFAARGELIYVFDRDLRYHYVNPAGARHLGKTPEEMVGTTWRELFPLPLYADQEARVGELLRTKLAAPVTRRTVDANGVPRIYESALTPILGADGEVELIVATAEDVTVRVLAEERAGQLQLLTQRLGATLSREEIGFIAIGQLHDYLGAAASLVFFASEDGAMQLAAHRGITEETIRERAEIPLDTPIPIARAIRTRTSVWFPDRASMLHEFPNVRDKRIASSSVEAVAAVPFVMEGHASGGLAFSFGTPTRFDGATRAFLETFALQCAQALERTRLFDDERRARIENARLFEAEREARTLRDDFLSIAGHELRTPLSTMHLQLEILRRQAISGALTDKPGVLVERLDQAMRNVDRLKQLIASLLDVSKIVAGRLAIDREPFDLRELAHEVTERFADVAGRAGSAMELVAAAPVAGNWDRGRLDQVITNLVDNAIKYGEGNPVSILIESRDGHARIAIRDQGLGIAADAQERIFGRFERAVSSRHYGGLGLGLWICRQLVEAHGGTIGVASAPGSGTTFVVEIPFDAAPVAS